MKRFISLAALLCIIFAAFAGCIAVLPPEETESAAILSPAAGTGSHTESGSQPAETEQASTGSETEPRTEKQTEKLTEEQTADQSEEQTEVQTEAHTEAHTEAQTEKQTEHVTEAPQAPDTEKQTEAPTEPATEAPAEPADPLDVDLKNFDAVLMDYISKTRTDNYMISPLSFKYALGMLIAGASGETRTELLEALGISDQNELENILKKFNSFAEGFNKFAEQDKEDPPSLQIANSVWKRKDIPADFKADYRLHLEMYNAELYTFELPDVIRNVNEWASKKTNGMIPELLPQNYSTDNLAIIIMNALYFKNSWIEPFEPDMTSEGDFTAKDGSVVKKDFMVGADSYNYYKDGVTELVTVPLRGNTAVTFVLGSYENVAEKIGKAKRAAVRLKIPKFESETALDRKELVAFLADCGVRRIFTEESDFSAMIDWDFSVTDIIQKTKISLDESGVEAAAVTAIIGRDKAICDPEDAVDFTLDRPFSFFIHTTQSEWTDGSNVILFEGEITK